MLTRQRIAARLGAFRRDRSGGVAVEYTLVAAIIGTALVTSFQPLTEAFVATFEAIASAF
ncbi:Flp family type IVb pilin [Aurantimonas endophytica]|uniref:Flp pilus assembly pilin Flp n=1 Tax=Aurantimonas endophytica TaxID=1522175 RepID=A0A7W6MS37_9HYPH|nr:Flp family type IVb pilin [Aurantimonas endophytica]MBB4005732.1 Flp pilus assembly pilin Flp [Aurantimonas endophytica]MCO6406317.1 Flp family type IVb pilin [Aurantimonas endophytica]